MTAKKTTATFRGSGGNDQRSTANFVAAKKTTAAFRGSGGNDQRSTANFVAAKKTTTAFRGSGGEARVHARSPTPSAHGKPI